VPYAGPDAMVFSNQRSNMLLEIHQVVVGMNYQGDKMFISNVLPLWLEASVELCGDRCPSELFFSRC